MQRNLLLNQATKIIHNWPVNLISQDSDDFRDEQSYTTNDVYLKSFGQAWVSPDSVIYKNGILIKETLAAFEKKKYYQFRHLAKKVLVAKKINLDSTGKFLLATDSWSAGHFHWFCEVLPRLLCIKKRASEFILLLPDTSYTRRMALESFKILGLEFEGIEWMQEDGFYKIRDLYYLSPIAPSGHMHRELMQQIRDSFFVAGKAGERRIYISRAKAKYRRVANEEQLMTKLKYHGFEIFQGEDLSLSDQVAIFSSCKIVLGIHGAGLTNCVFMQPGSKVIELRKKENGPSNVGYWHLADSLGHYYYYYNGIPDSDKPLVGRGCNLTIPVEDFSQTIIEKYLADKK